MPRSLLVVWFYTISFVVLLQSPACADVFPAGVERSGSSGISAANTADGCCWMYARARFVTDAPAGANTLVIEVYIPSYAIRAERPQAFTVRIDGGRAQLRCCYGPGSHRIAFNIAKEKRQQPVLVDVDAAYTFVPAEIGLNDDSRRLSVLLRSAEAINPVNGLSLQPIQRSRPYRIGVAVLFAIVFVGVTLLGWRSPAYAAAAVIVTDPFALYFGIGPTMITLPKIVLIAALPGAVRSLLRGFERPRAGVWIAAALAGLIASMALSALHAADRGAAVREVLKGLQYLATFGAVYALFRADPREGLMRNALVVVTAAVAVLALLQLVVGANESATLFGRVVPRISGPLEGPNQLAGFLGIVLPMLGAWLLCGVRTAAVWTSFALGLAALVPTFSRGGEAALAIALGLQFAVNQRPSQAAAVAATVAAWLSLLGLAFAQFAGALHWEWLFGRTLDEAGLGTRTELWNAAHELWRSSPWTGVGPGNFQLLVSRYYPGVMTHANSVYFNTLAEQGIIGEITLGSLLVALVVVFAKRLYVPLALGALGVITAMAFHQIVDTIWIYPKVGVLFWAVLGVAAAGVDARSR